MTVMTAIITIVTADNITKRSDGLAKRDRPMLR
jgi:hypothetical protein